VVDDRARVGQVLVEGPGHDVVRGLAVRARDLRVARVHRAGDVAAHADADQEHEPRADHERAMARGEDRDAVQQG
jgi:hypothetical protein